MESPVRNIKKKGHLQRTAFNLQKKNQTKIWSIVIEVFLYSIPAYTIAPPVCLSPGIYCKVKFTKT